MSLIINTNIKNDADGYLVDAENVKVNDRKMLDEYLADKETSFKDAIDNPLQTNTIYNLGSLVGDVTFTLPKDAKSGELIYICYTNIDHIVSISGDLINPAPLKLKCFSELMFMRVGTKWSVAYRGTTI